VRSAPTVVNAPYAVKDGDLISVIDVDKDPLSKVRSSSRFLLCCRDNTRRRGHHCPLTVPSPPIVGCSALLWLDVMFTVVGLGVVVVVAVGRLDARGGLLCHGTRAAPSAAAARATCT
jgi:hypothetical protein